MKYLHTFTVISYPLFRKLQESSDLTAKSSERYEEAFRNDLQEGAIHIAYYRVVMDGWDSTHRRMAPFMSELFGNSIMNIWQQYVDEGVLVIRPDSEFADVQPPHHSVLMRISKRTGLGAYARLAYLYALFDGLKFVPATQSTLLVISRCTGGTMDDSSYYPDDPIQQID